MPKREIFDSGQESPPLNLEKGRSILCPTKIGAFYYASFLKPQLTQNK
jgi:hypothetical protein